MIGVFLVPVSRGFFFLQYFKFFTSILYICNAFSGIYTVFQLQLLSLLCHYIITGLQSGVPSFLITKKPVFLNPILSSHKISAFKFGWINLPHLLKILYNGKFNSFENETLNTGSTLSLPCGSQLATLATSGFQIQ